MTSYLCKPGFMGVAIKRKVPNENQCGKEVRLAVSNLISSPEKLCSAPKAYISHGKQLYYLKMKVVKDYNELFVLLNNNRAIIVI